MTNWFEQYYSELVQFSTAIVFKRKLSIDPIDLVNEAYINFFDSGEEFDLPKVKTFISNHGYKERDYQNSKQNFGDKFCSKISHYHRADRVCNICNGLKTVGEYRVFKHIQGSIYIANYCFTCERKKHNIQFRAWLREGDNRDRWNAYMRNWQRKRSKTGLSREEWMKRRTANRKPIAELVRKAMKKYEAKNKENLTDAYIRKLIRHKRDLSPAAIEAKRQQLMAKRRLANSLAKAA